MDFIFGGNNRDCTNKEQILAKVRSAILEKDENHFSDINLQDDTWIPFKEEDGNEFTFIERFKENGGIFMYFESMENFKEALQQFVIENNWLPLLTTSHEIEEILSDSGIALSDDYRDSERRKNVSLITSDACAGSVAAYSFADTLLILARPSQFVSKLKDIFPLLRERYKESTPKNISIISGPSQSTAIENKLTIGAIGCKQIALFLVE